MSSATLPPPIDRFVQAVNQGDSQTFLSFFPKDGVVIDSGWRFAGHDAVRRWSDREFIQRPAGGGIRLRIGFAGIATIGWQYRISVSQARVCESVARVCGNGLIEIGDCSVNVQ